MITPISQDSWLGLNETMHVNALTRWSCFLDVNLSLIYWEQKMKIKDNVCQTTSSFLIPSKDTLTNHHLFQFLELPVFFFYTSIQKRCYCQHSCQNVSDPWQAPLVKTPASGACSAGVHGNSSACIVFNRCFRAKHSVQWVSPTHTPFTEVTWDIYNNYKGKM